MYGYPLSVGCVVLAAGNAVRFGGDKLSALLEGRSLLERALDAVPAEEFCAVAVVTRKKAQNGQQADAQNGEETDAQRIVKRYGFTLLTNPHPERGISGSVRIGLRAVLDCAVVSASTDHAVTDAAVPSHVGTEAAVQLHAVTKAAVLNRRCDAVLFQTADQPLLRRETVRKLVSLWRENPDKIAALARNGVRGNPCVFPARFFPELLDLSGDRGGSAVIRRHLSDLILLEADEAELMDADTREDLERIAEML